MQKIIEDLTSPEWWFTVVVAAIIVGLAGVYLARFVDGAWRRFVAMQANWSEAERLQRTNTVEHFLRNPHLLPFAISSVQVQVTAMVGIGIMATVAFVGAMVAFLILGTDRNAFPYPVLGLVFLGGVLTGVMLRIARRVRMRQGTLLEIQKGLGCFREGTISPQTLSH